MHRTSFVLLVFLLVHSFVGLFVYHFRVSALTFVTEFNSLLVVLIF